MRLLALLVVVAAVASGQKRYRLTFFRGGDQSSPVCNPIQAAEVVTRVENQCTQSIFNRNLYSIISSSDRSDYDGRIRTFSDSGVSRAKFFCACWCLSISPVHAAEEQRVRQFQRLLLQRWRDGGGRRHVSLLLNQCCVNGRGRRGAGAGGADAACTFLLRTNQRKKKTILT